MEQNPFILAFPLPSPPLSLFAPRTLRISCDSAWLLREPLHSEPRSVRPLYWGQRLKSRFWKLSRAQRLRAAKLSTLSPRKSAECVLNAITMASYIICGAQEKCGAPCSHARGIMCSFLPWHLFWPLMASFICYLVSHSVPGGGHGSSLLGCLENPMGRRAWWATVLRVAE